MAIPPVPEEGTAPPAATLTGPWAKDLETAFTDPEMQRTVDAFLREKVQPHVTRMEQTAAELADAKVLMDDLINKPGETFLALTEELFGSEQAGAVYKALQSGDVVEVDDGEGGVDLEVTKAAALDPETRALLDEIKADKQRVAYNTAVTETVAKYKDTVDIDPDLFHPFVHTAGGDMDQAAQAYKAYNEKYTAKYGAPLVVPEGQAPAPPVIGGANSAVTVPPVQKKYTMDSAFDEFFAEQKAAPPTI
jgi:hypothetical protein